MANSINYIRRYYLCIGCIRTDVNNNRATTIIKEYHQRHTARAYLDYGDGKGTAGKKMASVYNLKQTNLILGLPNIKRATDLRTFNNCAHTDKKTSHTKKVNLQNRPLQLYWVFGKLRTSEGHGVDEPYKALETITQKKRGVIFKIRAHRKAKLKPPKKTQPLQIGSTKSIDFYNCWYAEYPEMKVPGHGALSNAISEGDGGLCALDKEITCAVAGTANARRGSVKQLHSTVHGQENLSARNSGGPRMGPKPAVGPRGGFLKYTQRMNFKNFNFDSSS
ncbi:hypothetical protein CBL_05265 [Carabus blaptoides fortunei]